MDKEHCKTKNTQAKAFNLHSTCGMKIVNSIFAPDVSHNSLLLHMLESMKEKTVTLQIKAFNRTMR